MEKEMIKITHPETGESIEYPADQVQKIDPQPLPNEPNVYVRSDGELDKIGIPHGIAGEKRPHEANWVKRNRPLY